MLSHSACRTARRRGSRLAGSLRRGLASRLAFNLRRHESRAMMGELRAPAASGHYRRDAQKYRQPNFPSNYRRARRRHTGAAAPSRRRRKFLSGRWRSIE